MSEELRQVLAKEVESLAANFVMIDVNSQQELNDFLSQFKSIGQRAKDNEFPEYDSLCSLVMEYYSGIPADNTKKITEVLSYGLNLLQQAFSNPAAIDIVAAQNALISLTGASVNKQSQLASTQLKEVPEFLSNASGILDDIENDILAAEKDVHNEEKINAVLRAFHTLKGESGMLGLSNVSDLAHKAEDLLQKVKSKDIAIDSDIVSLILGLSDEFKEILKILGQDITHGVGYNVAASKEKIANIIESKLAGAQGTAALQAQAAPPKVAAYTAHVPKIDLEQNKDMLLEFLGESNDHLATAEESLLTLENDPQNADAINKIFRAFHTIKGVSSFLDLEDIRSLTHDTETMMDLVRKGTLKMNSGIADAVLSAIDASRKLMTLLKEQIDNNGQLQSAYYDISSVIAVVRGIVSGEPIHPKLGQILVDKGIVEEHELNNALQQQAQEKKDSKIGEILVEHNAATNGQINRALQEQQQAVVADQSVKISVGKLDNLIDTVGELVITGTQVAQNIHVASSEDARFIKDMSQLSRIIRDIQDISMSMRLVPIRPVFQKMQRLIRDVSKKAGKQVESRLAGEDTEIDKNIIDMVSDPLMHMVRNAVDHGVETADIRLSRGKTSNGTVSLDAYHKGGNIVIEVKDDGGGLNKDKILKKAREKGLVKENETPPDSKIFGLIFEPGFSTADKVTDISGRGVGMDVVKRNIDQLRGRVDITSEEGKGSVFMIKLPLTLAVIDGIVLMVGQERYIVPIFSVVEFIRPQTKDIVYINTKPSAMMVHGKLFPLINLAQHFQVKPLYQTLEDATVCVVESDYGRICMLVDRILGQQQVVIKSLGEKLRDVKGLSGGTILGDGRVGLILDINGIAALARGE